MKRIFIFILFLLLSFSTFKPAFAADSTCVVYFTGIGCSHCAKVDPVVLEELPGKYPNLVIIEYEIYQQRENAPIFYRYCENYSIPLDERGIPFALFDKKTRLVGDRPILKNIEKTLEGKKENSCPLIDGKVVSFEELDLSSLPGKPKIWTKDAQGFSPEKFQKPQPQKTSELTLPKVLSLAAVDAVNPCALAVLTLMLIAICTYDPRKKRNLLLAGLAFAASVFVMYLFYGLVIIRFFQLVQVLTNVRIWLYKILGFLAIILGILNIKDFIRYKPGGFLTEMPMFLRPKAQSLFFKVTSPKGAFSVGAFVTIFLLPCTIGPYVICGGILCTLSLLEALPWLLLYNLVFILPMIGITFACYIGFTTVENVSGWKEKNIRYLHLVAGIIIFSLGIAMFFGWV